MVLTKPSFREDHILKTLNIIFFIKQIKVYEVLIFNNRRDGPKTSNNSTKHLEVFLPMLDNDSLDDCLIFNAKSCKSL